jgi:hypothetical protein
MHQKRHRAIQNEFNQQEENNEEEQGSHPKEFRRKPNSFAAASNFSGFEPPVARQSTSKPSSSTSVHDLLDDCAEMSDLHPSSSQHSSSIDLLSLPSSSLSTSIIPSTSPVDSADSSLSYCAFGDLANGVSGIVSPAPITFSAIHQLDSNQPTSSWSLAPTSSSSMSDAGSDSLLSSASSHVSSGSTILSSDSTASPEFRKTRAYRFDGYFLFVAVHSCWCVFLFAS